jgi:hypothetical protein
MPKPKVIYAWNLPISHPDAVMFMGVQKNANGTGYKKLEVGDEPRHCEYCNKVVTNYPHTHTEADWDKHNDVQA